MALSISVGVEERAAVAGVKKIGKQVEELGDEFDKMARDGDSSFDKLAKSADQAGKKVKGNLTDGLGDVKKEAGQSGREAAASFSGGFDDVADFVQETFANAFGGFGPLGAAAGIAVAAAIGAALAGASDAQAKLEEARQAASDLASELYENGGEFPLQGRIDELFDALSKESGPNGPLQKLIDDFVDFGTVIDDVRDVARQTKLPLQQFMDALQPGDLDKTSELLEIVNDKIKEMRDARGGWVPVWDEEYQSLKSVAGQLQVVRDQTQLAIDLNDTVGKSLPPDLSEEIEAIGQAWRDAATDASDYITEQDGVTTFDWSTYLANAEATLAAANDYKKKIVTLPPEIQEEGSRIFAEQGAVAASAYVTAYESASAADQGRFVAAAAANGAAAGEAEGKALADSAYQAAKAREAGWGDLYMRVVAQDATDYGSLRARISRNLGTFSAPVVLGPGIGRQMLGP